MRVLLHRVQIIACRIDKPKDFLQILIVFLVLRLQPFHIDVLARSLASAASLIAFHLDSHFIVLKTLGFQYLVQLLNLFLGSQQLEGKVLVLPNPFVVGLILPFLIACKVPYEIIFLAVDAHLVGRYLPAAFVFDEGLELLDSIILQLHALLCIPVDSVVCLQFFLKLNNCFVSLVQPRS